MNDHRSPIASSASGRAQWPPSMSLSGSRSFSIVPHYRIIGTNAKIFLCGARPSRGQHVGQPRVEQVELVRAGQFGRNRGPAFHALRREPGEGSGELAFVGRREAAPMAGATEAPVGDRKSVVLGKSLVVRVVSGGLLVINTNKEYI